jgi:replication factor C subunit 3/5
MKVDRGLALQDLISGTYDYIEGLDFPPQTRVYILDQLATTEYASVPGRWQSRLGQLIAIPYRHRLSTGGNEKLQLTGLLGVFKHGVQLGAKS